MTDRRDELINLTHQFVDAFNRMSLDDVVAFFAEDGIYEDSTGGTHIGHDAIRTAFEPLDCRALMAPPPALSQSRVKTYQNCLR